MNRLLSAVIALLAISGAAHAQSIYKCTGPEGLMYRDTPCAADQREQATLAISRSAYSQPDSRVQNAPVQDNSLGNLPLQAIRLAIGMTDTQVLNLPSWGRPSQIIRSKAARIWREQWIYEEAGDERHLYFENGRLAAREDVPTSPWISSVVQARASFDATQ